MDSNTTRAALVCPSSRSCSANHRRNMMFSVPDASAAACSSSAMRGSRCTAPSLYARRTISGGFDIFVLAHAAFMVTNAVKNRIMWRIIYGLAVPHSARRVREIVQERVTRTMRSAQHVALKTVAWALPRWRVCGGHHVFGFREWVILCRTIGTHARGECPWEYVSWWTLPTWVHAHLHHWLFRL